MSTSDTVCTELQILTKKLEDLETSNSMVIRKLSEINKKRLESPMNTTITDLQSTIHFLKTQSGNRDQQHRIIREETSKLDKRVDQLSKSINRVQKTTYPLYRNAGAETTGLNIPNSNEGPKSRTLEQTTSLIDVSDTLRSEPPKKLKFHFSTNSAEVKRKRKSDQPLPRQPLAKNDIGLKCRSVCTDDDNRVKCLEGRDRELFKTPSKSSSLETDDKLNLPTRDEWKRKKLPRIREMDGTKPKLKLSPHYQARTQNEFRNLAGLNKDPNDQPDIKDFNSWITLAEKERQKGLSMNFLKTGQGPDTCLLLDLSGSMVGEPFNEMMVAVRTFVEGIASVFATQGIEENLGIATFGEQTGVIQHMTNDYDKVLEALDLLVPSGPSPMAAGLYMALACCFGHDSSTHIGKIPVKSRIIMFSDGKGTLDIKSSGDDDFESPLDFLKSVWLKETAEYLEKQSIRVYAVSVCSMEPASLEQVSETTHGKMFKSTEINKLVKMTQNTATAAKLVENGFDFTDSQVDDPEVKEEVLRYNLQGEWEDIVLQGKYIEKNYNINHYTELEDSNLPPLGSRVRRKPGWRYGDQDKGRPGTVVGHHKDRMSVFVEWDHGALIIYKSHTHFGQDVILVNEPRVLRDEIIAVGCCVKRGVDWKYGNEDGGLESIGVVLKVNANGLIIVRWPNKNKHQYRFGFDGLFDVQLCDGVKSSGRKEMPSQAADAESTEAYIASGSSSDHLENREIYHGESKDDRSNKTKKRPMSIKEFNERNRQLQTKEGKRTPAVQTNFKTDDVAWAYKKDGIWYTLPRDVNEKVEKAYGRNKHGSTILELNGCICQASFSDMKMVCQKTHTVTEIARNEASN
eukprot:XP_011446616.1 PREDICTED: uncharacterized protein LOC105341673 [Crassostrea gigas]